MRIAIRPRRDERANAHSFQCYGKDPTLRVNDGDGNTWEWLVRASELPATLLDVSDNTAQALSFFGQGDYDRALSWHSVCQFLVATAHVKELRCASQEIRASNGE
jgi:hypothetical protein